MEPNITKIINMHEFTVSELNKAIQGTLEGKFENIRVRGEISGLSKASSGHIYFSLKDNESLISAVIWRAISNKITFDPEDGMEVIIDGNIKTWAPASRYQIVVNNIEIAGEGALLKVIEDRKKKLSKEGLFDEYHKKELPYIPKCIGVITSGTGAAFRDIIKILRERFPINILLYPVLVQGKGAPEQIANAINKINKLGDGDKTIMEKNILIPDLLIVGRGGGSLEDLMAFNEEIVVRAIFDSEIPIISAVGHEIDTTLCDLVADCRAPTPTAAAEMAVPEKISLQNDINNLEGRLISETRKYLTLLKEKIENFSPSAPYMLFENKNLILKDKSNNLKNYILQKINNIKNDLDKKNILISSITSDLYKEKIKLDSILQKIISNLKNVLTTRELSIKTIPDVLHKKIKHSLELNRMSYLGPSGKLESLSYTNILKRGFAIVEDDNNKLIRSIKDIRKNSDININFKDGAIKAKVND